MEKKQVKKLAKFPEIPGVPEKITPTIQTEEEKECRILGWKQLIKDLPYCESVPDLDFIKDNLDEIPAKVICANSCCVGEDVGSDWTFVTLYFCFFDDGIFRIIEDESIMDSFLSRNNAAAVLHDHGGDIAKSWAEGYKLIIGILEEAFAFSIPEVPEGKK